MPTQTCFSIALLVTLLVLPGNAPADDVKLDRRPVFRNVSIVGYDDGRLHFRGVSRQVLKKPIAEVEWLTMDTLPLLADAERPPDNDQRRAMRVYDKLIAGARETWLRNLLQIRQAQARNRLPFDEAVAGYLNLLEQRVPGAAAARPNRPGPPGSPNHAAARAHLRTARSLGTHRLHKDDLLLLELELLLWDDIRPLPRPFSDMVRKRDKAPGQPAGDAPAAMFGDIPLETQDGLQLPSDSFVYEAIDEACDLEQYPVAQQRLTAAAAFTSKDDPGLLLRRARIALAEEPAAALPLLKSVQESGADLPIAARATYYEGLAYERLERDDLARQAWDRLLRHRGASQELRDLARVKRRR